MKRMSSLLLLFRRVCINVFHLLMLMHAKENLGISVQGHQAQGGGGGLVCLKASFVQQRTAPHFNAYHTLLSTQLDASESLDSLINKVN